MTAAHSTLTMAQTGLLILAHAPLASALQAVAQHVYPDCAPRLLALDVPAGMTPAEVEHRALELIDQAPFDEVLILTDVFGATPCNVAERLGSRRPIRVLSGVNVPMLWRALCYVDEPLDQLAERALSGAAQGVMPVSSRGPQYQERTISHAHQQRHDQQ